MTGLARRVSFATGAVGACFTSVASVGAVPAPQEQVSPSVTAWHVVDPFEGSGVPLCSLGACAIDEGPYPEDTLHVALRVGQERARSFISFDVNRLALEGTPATVTLRLPVGGEETGTVAAEQAELRACRVTSTVTPAQGEVGGEPDYDCSDAVTANRLDGEFAVDLTTVFSTWQRDGALSVAVVPVPPDAGNLPSWHISFESTTRVQGVPPVALLIEPAATATPAAGESSPPNDASPPIARPNPAPPRNAVVVSPASPSAMPTVEVGSLPSEPLARTIGFAYPGVFLLPFLLAILTSHFSRLLLAPASMRVDARWLTPR